MSAALALRRAFPEGSTVYTILRRVSRTGRQCDLGVIALGASYEDTGEVRQCALEAAAVLSLECGDCGDGRQFVTAWCAPENAGRLLVEALSVALYGYDKKGALRHESL